LSFSLLFGSEQPTANAAKLQQTSQNARFFNMIVPSSFRAKKNAGIGESNRRLLYGLFFNVSRLIADLRPYSHTGRGARLCARGLQPLCAYAVRILNKNL
jgi:hypothetical protein